MEYDVDYEIFKYINKQADHYVPLSKILEENHCTLAEAKQKLECFKADFSELLKKYQIGIENPVMMYCDLMNLAEEMPENRDLQYIYICMMTDSGLLNEIDSYERTDEQNVRNYFRQNEKIRQLSDFLELQMKYRDKVRYIKENMKKFNDFQGDFNEESELLYQLTLQHDFIEESTVYQDNLNALLNYINHDENMKLLKPYLIFAVLTRKHGMMQNRAGFIPNLKTVFQYQEYNIRSNNGKNFNNYKSYLELYDHLQRFYADDDEVDIELCGFCFSNTSPLSEWYYKHCQTDFEMPVSFAQKVKALKAISFPVLYCSTDYDDVVNTDEFDSEYSKVCRSFDKFVADNPQIVYDFIYAVYNGSPLQEYTDQLPYGKDFPQYAEFFLYVEAEILINNTMLGTGSMFTKI
ncbi:MAG: hypothetical protein NC340_09515 [Ruminococcus flavefaciens]|nr:hypothetical protein [Ruminococcus flavefaciens]MCM1232609.1 hypothetical protein [Ruminococcus flavefaciens]